MLRAGVQRSAGSGRAGGFTLLELLIAITVLTVAVGLTGSTIISISNYAESSREHSLARAAVFERLQELRGYGFQNIFRDHNGTTADDTAGAPGPAFNVAGLDAQEGDADGMVGRIEFPTTQAEPGILAEDLDLPQLGMPADLNADGLIDGNNHAADYRILPLRLVVEWTGQSGPSRLTVETVIGSW